MRYPSWLVTILMIAAIAALGVAASAQNTPVIPVPPTYPSITPDPSDLPYWTSMWNSYIMCTVGIQGNMKTNAAFDDDTDGRGDKIFMPAHGPNNWGVTGRYGICTVHTPLGGDPLITGDEDRPITFAGMEPCHYFGYWKLRIGSDMRMIGNKPGQWYSASLHSAPMSPTYYPGPPADMLGKEPYLGRMGPFLRAIWSTTGGNGSEIRTEIRIHLIRDMVRFEYRITNSGNKTERVGFEQIGDVETNDPIISDPNLSNGGFYGMYDNNCYCFAPGVGASKPVGSQHSMFFGGSAMVGGRPVARPPVPDYVSYYDNLTSPICTAMNIFNLEDATKPDMVAIGEYNDLYHRDDWLPIDYSPDPMHSILDMCWALCWDQKDLRPGETRTLVTYYGVGSATMRWTYKPTPSSKTPIPDYAVAAVEAPRSVKYDSTAILPGDPEFSPSQFPVTAWLCNNATDPGPFDLVDATATISLSPGLELVPSEGNDATKEIGLVQSGTESEPITWQVRATGQYSGELPIYVSFADTAGSHWQQTVVRNIYVPAVKRGVFPYGWNLMNVPFNFNDFRIEKVFDLVPGTFGAKYFDPVSGNYLTVTQVKPGQAFWIYVGGLTWGQKRPFYLDSTAAIVGEAPGTGQQVIVQDIALAKGWNMVGNPFVYPIYWGQVLVWSASNGGQTISLDEALRNKWLSPTLFSFNTDKQDYDTTSAKTALLNPWKGYWVYAYQPCHLVMRPPLFPTADVTANPGGQ